MNRLRKSQRRFATAILVGAVVAAIEGGVTFGGTHQARAHAGAGPIVPARFAATLFAAAPAGLSNPDDITR